MRKSSIESQYYSSYFCPIKKIKVMVSRNKYTTTGSRYSAEYDEPIKVTLLARKMLQLEKEKKRNEQLAYIEKCLSNITF